MASDSRQRMVDSAVTLFRERGVAATGFREVALHSNVSRGSIGHHFPGGKSELVAEALRSAGAAGRTALERAVDGAEVREAVEAFASLWRAMLEATELRGGCTIAAVVTETTDAATLALARDVFRSWRTPLADAFGRAGVDDVRAHSLATMVLGALEGALVLARAERDLEPFDTVMRELLGLLACALPRPA